MERLLPGAPQPIVNSTLTNLYKRVPRATKAWPAHGSPSHTLTSRSYLPMWQPGAAAASGRAQGAGEGRGATSYELPHPCALVTGELGSPP